MRSYGKPKLISSSSGSEFPNKFNADVEKGRSSDSPDLSEAHLYFCSSHRCNTGATFPSLLSFAKSNGVTKEEFFPYDPDTFNTCSLKDGFDDPDNITFLDSYTELNGVLAIKESIFNNGPVVVGMKVYDDFFYYTEGIYRHVWGGLAGYHAVLLVGYGLTKAKRCFGLGTTKFFIVKNSWSEGWGEDGFF
jgi:Papain family cysteine protease.